MHGGAGILGVTIALLGSAAVGTPGSARRARPIAAAALSRAVLGACVQAQARALQWTEHT